MGTETGNIKKMFENSSSVEQYKMHTHYNLFSRRKAVFDLLKGTHFKKVLDLGCGGGGYLDIKKRHDCAYFGLDFSENMINAAKDRARELGIEEEVFLQRGSAENTSYEDNSFDLVLGVGLIEYFERPDKLIEEIRRVLKQDGILIMQSFIPNPYVHALTPIFEGIIDFVRFLKRKGKKVAHKKYTKGQLDDLLTRNGFQLIDFTYSTFYLLPITPLNIFLRKIDAHLSQYLASKDGKRFGFFAVNYIGKYRFTK